MSDEVLLIDDHLLLQVLLGDQPSSLRTDGAHIATTGLWYHRLCRALSDQTVVGSMSRQLGTDLAVAAAAVGAVIELPPGIGIISLRTLGWPMGRLAAEGERLNLLALEALAAGLHLEAEICLAERNSSPPLLEAAARHGIRVTSIRT